MKREKMMERDASIGYIDWMRMRGESGQALVELALVLPVFVLLLIGSAEFARLAYASIEVANAARAGIQYGAQNRSTSVDLTGMEAAAVQDAANVTALQASAANFCVCGSGGPINCASAQSSCNGRILDYVQVNTSATVDPLFHCPGLPKTFTMYGQAVMRVEQ